MGLSLEFLTGNIPRIVEAVRTIDPDALDDPEVVTGRADLSLHIIPYDLNLLSRAIGLHSSQPVQDLRPSLAALEDFSDRGVLAVAPEWVAYIASLPTERIPAAVETWFGLMREAHNEPDLQSSSDALTAVAELVSLCRYGVQTGSEVVHLWYR